MKDQSGKTPLEWIITIVIALLIAGVSIAMIFGDTDDIKNMIKEFVNKNNTVQTENK